MISPEPPERTRSYDGEGIPLAGTEGGSSLQSGAGSSDPPSSPERPQQPPNADSLPVSANDACLSG